MEGVIWLGIFTLALLLLDIYCIYKVVDYFRMKKNGVCCYAKITKLVDFNTKLSELNPGRRRDYHIILLAKDIEGYHQLCELSTRAWKRSFVSRRMRRVPTYYQDLKDIIGKNIENGFKTFSKEYKLSLEYIISSVTFIMFSFLKSLSSDNI